MAEFGKLNTSVAFNPTSAFPLDARCYFESLDLAKAAAATAEPVGSTNTVYYIGQKLLVNDGTTSKWYTIQSDNTLLEEGGSSSQSVDGLTVIATTSSELKNLVIKDNQLIFIQDLGRIAFDHEGSRVFYNQIVEINTEAERAALDSPLSGYYFVIDTAVLWCYKDEWIQITEKPDEVIFIGTELPELGQVKTLYVDKDKLEISIWDEETDQYIVVSNYTHEVTDEDIEQMFS